MMTLHSRLDEALARLRAALHRLEAAVEQRAEADLGRTERDREFSLLQEDRSRLAAELDAALARNARLLTAQTEVSHRLDRAGRTVDHLLQNLAGNTGAPAPARAPEEAR
jgi:hypothetical protein